MTSTSPSEADEPPFKVEALTKAHDRATFTCGSEPLDRYFKTQVTQDIRRRLGKCFVAVEKTSGEVVGFYTLSALSIAFGELSEELTKKLPRYPVIPAVLIGRIAVATKMQGKKLGTALLAHAIETVEKNDVGAFAIVVDAKDSAAVNFYKRHGFQAIQKQNNRLVITIEEGLKSLCQ